MKKIKKLFSFMIVLFAMLTCTFLFSACGFGGGGEPEDPGSTVDPSGPQEPEDYWYSYVFYLEDGGEIYHTIQADNWEDFQLPQNPTQEGAVFLGWKNSEGQIIFDANGEWNNYQNQALLYPRWGKTIHVTYLLGDVELDEEPSNIEIFENYGDNANNYIWLNSLQPKDSANHMFIGWYLNSDFSGEQIYCIIPENCDEDITLYARWGEKYNVSYVLNAKDIDNVDEVRLTLERDYSSYWSGVSNQLYSDISRKGYIFDGWYLDKELTQKVSNISETQTGNITLYAKWATNFIVSGTKITGISKYSGETLLTIPGEINGIKIDTISTGAFENLTALEKVVIGNGIAVIENNAFSGCAKLTVVSIPSSIAYVTKNSFSGSSLEKVIIGENQTAINSFSCRTDFTKFYISDTVQKISAEAFKGNKNIEEIVISKSVCEIGKKAFYGCSNLKSVEFENVDSEIGDLSIGDYAFYNCSKLTALELPEQLTHIGASAFLCYKKDTDEYYGNIETVTFNKNMNMLYIGEKAFAYQKIKTLAFPAFGQKRCGGFQFDKYAFAGNEKLESVKFSSPSTLWQYRSFIGGLAFEDCYNLSSVEFANVLQDWDNQIFDGCHSLKEITIPESARAVRYVTSSGNTEYYKNCFDGLYLVRIKDLTDGNSNITLSATEEITSGEFEGRFVNDGKFEYYVYNNEKILVGVVDKTITNGNDIAEDITGIRANAFYGANSLESVTIPEGITYIPDGLFRNLVTLKTVSLPTSLTGIGSSVFAGTCIENLTIPAGVSYISFSYIENLKTLTISGNISSISLNYCKNLETVIFNGLVEKVDSSSFIDCTNLRSVSFNGGITEIQKYAFYKCTNLESVTFGENSGLESIGNEAFYRCYNLKSITIPASVKTIGSYAFENCNRLETVLFEDGIALESIMAGAFKGCESLKTISIPYVSGNLKTNSLFRGCSALESVSFANKITTIEDYAFYDCSNLTQIDLDGITAIGKEAFNYCFGLLEIKLPETLANVGKKAFANCNNIVHIRNLSAIEKTEILEAFEDSSLAEYLSVAYDNGNSETFFESELVVGAKYITLVKGENVYLLGFKDKTQTQATDIPSNVTHISSMAFYGSGLTSVIIPSSVKEIGAYAFALSSLETVTMSDSVKVIGELAFCETKIKTITIPAGVQEIGEGAFSESMLESVVFADGFALKTFGDWFSDCENLKTITIPDGVESITGTFEGTAIESIRIPASVKTIGDYAFADCRSLTEVEFEDGALLEEIGFRAFGSCKSLETITLPNTVKTIGNYAFIASGIINIDLPENLESIGSNVFANCTALTEITIPAGVLSIGDQAFDGCSALGQVTFAGTAITELAGFSNCTALTEIIIPEGVTTIGDNAFSGCENLKTVTFPTTLKTIYSSAFYTQNNFGSCYGLLNVRNLSGKTFEAHQDYAEVVTTDTGEFVGKVEICGKYIIFDNGADKVLIGLTDIEITDATDIPSDVTIIGAFAFYGSSVEHVELVNIKKIYESAFRSCNLKTVLILGDKKTIIGDYAFSASTVKNLQMGDNAVGEIGSYAFANTSLASVAIPAGVTHIGDHAFYNCTGLVNVEFSENGKLEVIGTSAFEKTAVSSVYLPMNLKTIGIHAFYETNIQSVDCDENILVKNIGEKAFYNKNGSSILFEHWFKKATSIGAYAFENAIFKVNSIEISGGVAYVGVGAFKNACLQGKSSYDGEKTIILNSSCSDYVTFGQECFYGINGIKEIIINAGKYDFGKGAFANISCDNITFKSGAQLSVSEEMFVNSQLDKIIFEIVPTNIYKKAFYESDATITFKDNGKGIKVIGEYAFYGVKSLNIDLSSVTSIGEYAFADIDSLSVIDFDKNVNLTTIPAYAFYQSRLKTIAISNNITKIGEKAFYETDAVVTFKDNGKGIKIIGKYAFYDVKSLNIDLSSATSVGEYAFADIDSISVIDLDKNANLTTIPDYAFYQSGLKTIAISNNITKIGDYAFYECHLGKVDFLTPNITEIGSGAFENGGYILSATIPQSVTKIGDSAFYRVLQVINYSSVDLSDYNFNEYSTTGTDLKIEIFIDEHYVGYIESGEKYLYRAYVDVKDVVIGNDITKISEHAFSVNSCLTSVTIGDSVTGIGDGSFDRCYALASIIIPASVTSIGSFAFDECDNLESIYYKGTIDQWAQIEFYNETANPLTRTNNLYINSELVTEVNLVSATKISAYAFYGYTGLTSITIPESVTSIGDMAFYGCTSLADVYITDIDKWATISFANSFSNPLCYAKNLYLNGALVTDAVLSSATKISAYAFYDYTPLTSVTIPDSVTEIANFAFNGCTALKSVVIGSGVSEISYDAFADCGTEKVYYKGTQSEWNELQSLGNIGLESATIYFYSETEPAMGGNYWRLVDGVATVWEN